ncbi:MAG: tetratricopeptide repeat protein [Chloroflexi bacterium]|nr:tetratricopeptide repeat protein [Chloroflexota bacterium]
MYDKYPVYDVPQRNIIQRFFAQRWSAILLEIALTIVITVAAGRAFDFFDPFDGEPAAIPPAATETMSQATNVALEPFTQRGIDYIQSREFAAAEAMYDFAIAVAPEDAKHYGWRGYVNLQAGDYLAAQRDFRQVLELAPADNDAHVALCWAYGESGDFAAALSHCEEALLAAQSLPQYAIALENRCWLKVEMGEFDAAARDCLDVLEIFPDCQQEVCALAHYNLGRIMLAQGKQEEALRQFNLAYHIGSSYPKMYLEIANVYDTLGYEAAARVSYEHYRSLAVGGA